MRHEGILSGFGLGKPEIEGLILAARVKAGWITEADLAPPPAEEDEGGAEAEDGAVEGEAAVAEPSRAVPRDGRGGKETRCCGRSLKQSDRTAAWRPTRPFAAAR